MKWIKVVNVGTIPTDKRQVLCKHKDGYYIVLRFRFDEGLMTSVAPTHEELIKWTEIEKYCLITD